MLSNLARMPLFCELLWEIYSLKTGSWKKLELNMPYCHYCVSRAGVRVYLDEIVIGRVNTKLRLMINNVWCPST